MTPDRLAHYICLRYAGCLVSYTGNRFTFIMKAKPVQRLDAMDLVALSIDARRKEGTPEHAQAKRLSEQAVRLWKKQLSRRLSRKCPHCGGSL